MSSVGADTVGESETVLLNVEFVQLQPVKTYPLFGVAVRFAVVKTVMVAALLAALPPLAAFTVML